MNSRKSGRGICKRGTLYFSLPPHAQMSIALLSAAGMFAKKPTSSPSTISRHSCTRPAPMSDKSRTPRGMVAPLSAFCRFFMTALHKVSSSRSLRHSAASSVIQVVTSSSFVS
eukprot:11180633-Lingulodinium_polyedra.AAC.1